MKMKKFLRCSTISLLYLLSLSNNPVSARDVILGDINNDGYITNNDRYSLNEYLGSDAKGKSDDFNHDAADIDRDGMVTEDDSTILTRYLAGWEGYEDLSAFAVELEVRDLTVNQSMMMTGETVTILAESNRAAEELVYTADVYLDNTKIDSIVGDGALNYVPTQSGVYSFDIRIIDDISGAESAWYLDRCVDVFPYWSLDDIELSTTNCEVGENITFTAVIDGNTAGLDYQFTLYKDNTEYYIAPDNNSPVFSFPVMETGVYSVSLSVGDSYDYYGCYMVSSNITVRDLSVDVPEQTIRETLNADELHRKKANEVIVAQKDITLTWDRLSTDTSYELYIGGPSNTSIHFDDYTSNSYVIPASFLVAGKEYDVDLWRYGSSNSRYFSFTVTGAESILQESPPEILIPKNSQTYPFSDISIYWNKMNYVTHYELVLQYNCGNKWHDMMKIQLDKNKTSHTLSQNDLHPGCEHRVYIYAYDALGNELYDRSHFYIEGDKEVCRLTDPVITSKNFFDSRAYNVIKTIPSYGNVDVLWNDVPAAEFYSLEISDISTNEALKLVDMENIISNQYSIPINQLISGRIYRVRVYAHHLKDCKCASDIMYFRAPYTGNRVLDPVQVISHDFSTDSNEPSVITIQELNIEWSPATAAIKYDVEWFWYDEDEYPDFASYGQSGTKVTIPKDDVLGLSDDAKEYFRLCITAYDSNGNTSQNKYYIKPVSSQITAPVLLSPAFTKNEDGPYPAYSINDIPITWGKVKDAVKYKVRLYEYYEEDWDAIWTQEDITALSYEIPEDELYNGVFKIRITAIDQYGNSLPSDSYYFQVGTSGYIDLSLNEWTAPYNASNKFTTISTSGKWTAKVSDRWITLDQMNGDGTYRVKISVAENIDDFPRAGSVTFTNASGGFAVFSITQAPDNSSSTGALKISVPEYGSMVDYGKTTAKWSYKSDYAYFNVQLKNIITEKTVYENRTVEFKDILPVSVLAYGHTYQLIVSAYNASNVKVSESSSVFKVENFAGSLPEEDDTDDPEIVEPEISVGENKIVLSGITDGAVINLSDISLSWLNVNNAKFYNIALLDVTEDSGASNDAALDKVLDKTTEILTDKISSSLLMRGHKYRLWVSAHAADSKLIADKYVTFTVKESVTSDSGTPSTDFDTGVLNLAVGETFDFDGTVYANGGTLEQIRVTVREASTGNFCDYAIYDAAAIASFGSTSVFDLSNIYRISTGVGTNIGTSGSGYADAGSQTLELTQVGSRYSINVYAKNVNGKMILLATKDIVLTAEPFVRFYDKNGNDLNGTTLNVGYSAFNGKTVYVETNVNISAWNDSSNAFRVDIVDTQYTDDSVIYTYSVKGSQNPSGNKRYGELRVYETEGKVTSSSKKWGSINIVQDGNPNVPIFVDAYVKNGSEYYNDDNPMKFVVGDHNYQNGYTLAVETKNTVENVSWTVYTDNPSVATVYRSNGKVYVQAKGAGTARLYISHIYTKNFAELDPAVTNYVCDIKVSSPYNALIIADPTYIPWSNGDITYYGILQRDNESIAMKKLFESMSFNNGTSINGFDQIYTPEEKSYDGAVTIEYIRNACQELAQRTSEHSVTYIYILCHGDESGTLNFGLDDINPPITSRPTDSVALTLNELKNMLDPIQGKIVFILGSCHSGQAIDKVDNSIWNTFKNILFSVQNTDGVFREENKYFILTAAMYNETSTSSMERYFDEESQTVVVDENKSYDLFTLALSQTLGWNYLDEDTPPSVTYSMSLEKTHSQILQYITKWSYEDGTEGEGLIETPQVFPENSDFIVFEKVN